MATPHYKKHLVTSPDDHNVTGINPLYLIRVNSGGTALEGVDPSSITAPLIIIDYIPFKALYGSYQPESQYEVTDVTNVLGFGAGFVIRFTPEIPNDRYISGVATSDGRLIVIDIVNDYASRIEDDLSIQENRKYFNIIPPVNRKILAINDTLTINSDEDVVVFGSYTVLGTLTVNGTGKFVVITGTVGKVLRFDADGYPTDSLIEIRDDGRVNTPTLSSPVSVAGDFWFEEDATTTYLCRKHSVTGLVTKVQMVS